MAFVYDESDDRGAGPSSVPYHKQNANGGFIRHYGNYLYLKFIVDHNDTTFFERQQAYDEIAIAERKMDYWKKHPNFNAQACEPDLIRLRKHWASPPTTEKPKPKPAWRRPPVEAPGVTSTPRAGNPERALATKVTQRITRAEQDRRSAALRAHLQAQGRDKA